MIQQQETYSMMSRLVELECRWSHMQCGQKARNEKERYFPFFRSAIFTVNHTEQKYNVFMHALLVQCPLFEVVDCD